MKHLQGTVDFHITYKLDFKKKFSIELALLLVDNTPIPTVIRYDWDDFLTDAVSTSVPISSPRHLHCAYVLV